MSVIIKNNVVPSKFYLSNNFPNPFNPATNFEFSLPKTGMVSLKIFDMIGREVAVLVNEVKPAGTYQVTWNAAHLACGVYFCKLQTGLMSEVKKAILLK